MTTTTAVTWDDATLARLKFARWYAEKVGGDNLPTDTTPNIHERDTRIIHVWPTRTYTEGPGGTLRVYMDLHHIADKKVLQAMMNAIVDDYYECGYVVHDHRTPWRRP